jgi:hypothetical protein
MRFHTMLQPRRPTTGYRLAKEKKKTKILPKRKEKERAKKGEERSKQI